MINIGELDRRIGLMKPSVSTPNAAGESSETFSLAITVWARVRQATANEQIRNNRTSTTAPYAIRIRYQPDIDETWRISYGSKTLNISSVVEIGRREALDIVATEHRN